MTVYWPEATAAFSSEMRWSEAPATGAEEAVLSKRAEFEIETISPPAETPAALAPDDLAASLPCLVPSSTFRVLPLVGLVMEFWMGFIADILLVSDLTTQSGRT
ncbi:hypothetical protein THIX_10132 [Thiomonas sp. X19]|nr:hypothetical protein THIX_10132 [Thiomonas sp. X19]